MSLRFRAVRVELQTKEGQYGTSVAFPSGLVVLRADNTSGKSSLLMSILYALGLDGMLGPGEYMPLPKRLSDGKRVLDVIGGRILVELEGKAGKPVTIERNALGTQQDRQLIKLFRGPYLTQSVPITHYEETGYMVRVPGGAARETGFHHFLADFVGLKLPILSRSDGNEGPLYLECLFPYFFVDQLTGWRDIKSRMPSYLQIPDMARRTAEFVLGLSIFERAKRLQELHVRKGQLEVHWTRLRSDIHARGAAIGAVAIGIPDHMPPQPIDWDYQVLEQDSWRDLNTGIRFVNDRMIALGDFAQMPETTPQNVVAEIQELESSLGKLDADIRQVSFERSLDKQQSDAARNRMDQITAELRKYKDIQSLRSRGALRDLKIESHVCPTCEQPLEDVLLRQPTKVRPLSIAENIGYLEDQKRLFESMTRESTTAYEIKSARVVDLVAQLEDVTRQIQVARREAAGSLGGPSPSRIEERLRLEGRAEKFSGLQSYRKEADGVLSELIAEHGKIREELTRLRGAQLELFDRRKLERFEQLFREQLGAYGFKSIPLHEMGIGFHTYRPCHRLDGVEHDVGLTSASDSVRMVWAYVIGLLELSREFEMNHLGFLVLDEPKQQSAADLSFEALLRRAAGAGQVNQQILFATSQTQDSLKRMLQGLKHTYVELPVPVFQKM